LRGGRLRFGTNGVQRAHLQRRCALPPMFDAWPAGLQRLTANGVEAHGCRSMRTGERTVECTVVCSPTVHSSLGFSVLCHVRRARLTSRAVCCFFRASKPSDELLLQHVYGFTRGSAVSCNTGVGRVARCYEYVGPVNDYNYGVPPRPRAHVSGVKMSGPMSVCRPRA
jgi:hypothetical protein